MNIENSILNMTINQFLNGGKDMNELSIKEKMKLEALTRLEMLNAAPLVRAKILNDWKLTKCVVNWGDYFYDDTQSITDDEMRLIREFEEEYECAVYYVILDEGIWPDGCKFPRYTFLYVSQNEEEWEFDKEECIKRCQTVPAYVINMEVPEYSEITEIQYCEAAGKISNLT